MEITPPRRRNRAPDTRHRPDRRHRGLTKTFNIRETLFKAFLSEIERQTDDPDFPREYGPATVRLITEWLTARGIEIKRGIESALHPALAGCFA